MSSGSNADSAFDAGSTTNILESNPRPDLWDPIHGTAAVSYINHLPGCISVHVWSPH